MFVVQKNKKKEKKNRVRVSYAFMRLFHTILLSTCKMKMIFLRFCHQMVACGWSIDLLTIVREGNWIFVYENSIKPFNAFPKSTLVKSTASRIHQNTKRFWLNKMECERERVYFVNVNDFE